MPFFYVNTTSRSYNHDLGLWFSLGFRLSRLWGLIIEIMLDFNYWSKSFLSLLFLQFYWDSYTFFYVLLNFLFNLFDLINKKYLYANEIFSSTNNRCMPQGLLWASRLGLNCVQVKGPGIHIHSSSTSLFINGKSQLPWRITSNIQDLIYPKSKFSQILLTHIFRKDNIMTNALNLSTIIIFGFYSFVVSVRFTKYSYYDYKISK